MKELSLLFACHVRKSSIADSLARGALSQGLKRESTSDYEPEIPSADMQSRCATSLGRSRAMPQGSTTGTSVSVSMHFMSCGMSHWRQTITTTMTPINNIAGTVTPRPPVRRKNPENSWSRKKP